MASYEADWVERGEDDGKGKLDDGEGVKTLESVSGELGKRQH